MILCETLAVVDPHARVIAPDLCTDRTITMRPIHPSDAAEHLAGEDAELVKWLKRWPRQRRDCASAHPAR